MRGWPIITYRLIVMASTVNNETANKPYRNNGYKRHSSSPCVQARFQNVLAASGKLKQQNNKSDNERFMMNTAVALRTWKSYRYETIKILWNWFSWKFGLLCVSAIKFYYAENKGKKYNPCLMVHFMVELFGWASATEKNHDKKLKWPFIYNYKYTNFKAKQNESSVICAIARYLILNESVHKKWHIFIMQSIYSSNIFIRSNSGPWTMPQYQ